VTFLLFLYPRRWRERYGAELAALVRHQRWTPALVIDLVAGAIDARLHPQPLPRPSSGTEGDDAMFARLMKFRCAGYGPTVTPRDQWISVAVMIGGTLVLTLIWMGFHLKYGDNPYVDAFSLTPFLMAMLLSLPMTSLKGRSWLAQTIFVAGGIVVLIVTSLAVGFITARL
jgi:hypothetical protein